MSEANLFNSTKRKDKYMIDPRLIEVEEGFNPRTLPYPGEKFQELKASIAEVGLQESLTVRDNPKKKGWFLLTDGENRLRAVKELIAEGHEIERVSCEKKRQNREMATISALIHGNGVPLTKYDRGLAYQRLLNWGVDIKEIQKKTGINNVNVIYDCIRLAEAPAKIRKAMENNDITQTAVLKIMRAEKDEDKQIEIVQNAIEEKSEKRGKSEKKKPATARNVKGIKHTSPMAKFKQLCDLVAESNDQKPERAMMLEVLRAGLLDKKITAEDLMKYFVNVDNGNGHAGEEVNIGEEVNTGEEVSTGEEVHS